MAPTNYRLTTPPGNSFATSVWIKRGSQYCSVYKVENNEAFNSFAASIEADDEDEFSVIYRDQQYPTPQASRGVWLYLDGEQVGFHFLDKSNYYYKKNPSDPSREFIVSERDKDHSKLEFNLEEGKSSGKVDIRVCRIENFRLENPIFTAHFNMNEVFQEGFLKKETSGDKTYEFNTFDEEDPISNPYLSFTFTYMTEALLIEKGLLPHPPPFSARSSSLASTSKQVATPKKKLEEEEKESASGDSSNEEDDDFLKGLKSLKKGSEDKAERLEIEAKGVRIQAKETGELIERTRKRRKEEQSDEVSNKKCKEEKGKSPSKNDEKEKGRETRSSSKK